MITISACLSAVSESVCPLSIIPDFSANSIAVSSQSIPDRFPGPRALSAIAIDPPRSPRPTIVMIKSLMSKLSPPV